MLVSQITGVIFMGSAVFAPLYFFLKKRSVVKSPDNLAIILCSAAAAVAVGVGLFTEY
jgi:hypothetical protein